MTTAARKALARAGLKVALSVAKKVEKWAVCLVARKAGLTDKWTAVKLAVL